VSGWGKGSRHSEKTRKRIALTQRTRRERLRREAKLRPRDIDQWLASGVVTTAMRGTLEIAMEEHVDLAKALAGQGVLTPDRRAVLEDHAGLGVALALSVRAIDPEKPDEALLGRIVQLTAARRACLRALGLVGAQLEGGDEREGLSASAYGAALRGARASNGGGETGAADAGVPGRPAEPPTEGSGVGEVLSSSADGPFRTPAGGRARD